MKRLSVLAVCALVSACQGQDPLSTVSPPTSSTTLKTASASAPLAARPSYPAIEKPNAQGHIQLSGQQLTLSLELYPKAEPGFATQKLDLSTATKILATVTDSHGKTYTATNSDANGVNYSGGPITLTFNGLLPDPLLFVNVQAKVGATPIVQTELASVIKHTSSASSATALLNFQTTVAAKALQAMLPANAERARAIDLIALESLTQAITGQTGSAPNFTYPSNHPSLVNTGLLSTDLLTQAPGDLIANPVPYRQNGATVNVTISGLTGTDKVQLQVTDAASAIQTDLSNGSFSVVGATPGAGIRAIVTPFGSPTQTYTYTLNPVSPFPLTQGTPSTLTITAIPIVSISSFTPASGKASDEVTINGVGFAGTPTVTFNGSSAAVITANTGTQLKVLIPADATDGKITVTNGSSVSSATDFNVNRTIYVNATAGGSNNGSNWDNAYTSLQNALSAAGAGDEIWVAAGTYKPVEPAILAAPTLAERDVSFQLKANVKIYGGFAGTEPAIADRTASLTDFVTILSGDLDGNDNYTGTPGTNLDDNAYHVVEGVNNASLDGVTIKGGNANGSNPNNFGGGMYNFGSLTMTNLTFANNSATSGGGGMYNGASSSTMTNLTFANNSATSGGGGMYNLGSSSITMTNLTFANNSASYGGGMINIASGTTMTNLTFANNSATSGGGGMYNQNSNSTLKNVLFWKSSPSFTISSVDGNYDLGTGADPFIDSTNPLANGLRLKDLATANSLVGDNTGVFATDILGNPRPGAIGTGNTTVESGAYEFVPPPLPANVLVVKKGAPAGGDGRTWSGAYNDLQTALAAATAGQEIWVAAGTYKPVEPATLAAPTPAERNISFQLKANVNIYGGFAGTESALTDRTASLTDFVTVLSGDIDNNDVYTPTVSGLTNNSKTVVLGANNTTLDGVTIQGGNASDSSGLGPGRYGGGMYNASSSPTLSNVSFASNSATNGGGMYNDSSSPTLTNVSFASNSAGSSNGRGGGIYNALSSPMLSNVSFASNSATNGGGIYNASSSPTLSNVSFASNSAGSSGGGMFNTGSSPTLSNVSFASNSAGSNGGGMFNNSSSSPTLSNVSFASNSASLGGGGGMYNSSSSPTLSNVSFASNSAGSNGGGGMYNSVSSPILKNVLLWNSTLFSQAIDNAQGNYDRGNLPANNPFVDSTNPLNNGLRIKDLTTANAIAGVSTGAPLQDILAKDRPATLTLGGNTSVESGAYEYYLP